MYGQCCRGHCGNGGEVSLALLLSLLVLIAVGLKQLAMREKEVICELGLVLELDQVHGLMVLHCKLQNHEL